MAYLKEGTVIVLDVGSNMKQAVQGKSTALDISIQCITRMLQNKLFVESKDEFGLVLFGSDETENRLNEVSEDRYNFITAASEIKLVDWDLLDILAKLKPSDNQGDVLEALKVGLDVIEQDAAASKRKRFGSRRMILFSNLNGPTSGTLSQMDSFFSDLKNADVGTFQLIGRDLEDEPPKQESGRHSPKKGAKTDKKSYTTAQLLDHLLDKLVEEGINEDKESYSYAAALEYSTAFSSRQVRPTPWKGMLEIGSLLKIPVVGYSKVKESRPKQTWKKSYATDPSVSIIQSSEYFVQRGLQREQVAGEEIIDAYKYGSTLVPFTEEDKQSLKFTGVGKCLKVLGFAAKDQVKEQLYVANDVKIITAAQTEEPALLAMSALVRALNEENMVIIARFGYNAISAPKLVSLSPHVAKDGSYEGLYFHYLPFEDDLRYYTFLSLVTNPAEQFKPSKEQLDAVGDLIDKLTLKEDDEEYAQITPKKIVNPYLQRLYHALQQRAVSPEEPLPDFDQALLGKLVMPERLAKDAKEAAQEVKRLFPLKKVEPKRKFKKEGIFGEGGEEAAAMEVDGDAADGVVSAPGFTDLKKTVVTSIGTITPADDFRIMVSDADKNKFIDACRKAGDVADQLIFKTFEGSSYADKVVLLLSVVREESAKRDIPEQFNSYLTTFKEQLLAKDFTDVWDKLVSRNLTLVSKSEAKSSHVSPKEAESFLHVKKTAHVESKKHAPAAAEDDMIDEMFG